jgi:glycerophosphoryl diester phosphodiesterase
MLIFGHRGSSGTDPENTLRSFRVAIAAGADGIELDVQATGDGIPVIIHDHDLSRTTDGTGKVSSRSLAELKQLNAGHGEQIPTLDEVMALVAGKLTVDIEVKQSGIEATVLNTLAKYSMADWFISSFEWDVLLAAQRLNPSAPLWPLALALDDAVLAIADRLSSPGIALLHSAYTAEAAAHCTQAGLAVGVWTVNDPAEGHRVRELGATALMTDFPAMMRAELGS